MELFAWLLGVAAMVLDYTVYYTVVTMGNYVHQLSAIGLAWRVLRDIGNIVLIFGFLAIGITTILNVDWYGGRTKMLPMLLVAAVFLNFSLFISEAVIDTGNLFATEFYTQINGGHLPDLANLTTSNEGISSKIMSQLGLQTIYGNGRTNPAILNHSWLVGFMGIILFLIAAFVMFSLAFVLITRFIMLIFLIIIAPIGFAGLAVPKLTGPAKLWWSTLFEQTITAPVLLLLLYIALRVITAQTFLTGFGVGNNQTAWNGFFNNASLTDFGSIMLSFIVAMGLLLAVVVISKKMSAAGGGWATKMGGKLSFGLVAAGGRGTIGLGSNYAAKKLRESRLGGTKTGRILAGGFDRGAKASFDVRSTKALKNLPGGGVDAGVAVVGGYRARYEKGMKAHEEYAKSLKGPETTKKQEESMENARVAHNTAVTAHNEAKNTHEKIIEQEEAKQKEIELLEEEKAKNDKYTIKDASALETERKLTDARSDLKMIKKARETSFTKIDETKNTADKLKKEKEAIDKSVAKTTTDVGKELQESYGKNIRDLGIIGSLVLGFGSSGAGQTAARKIIKDATKKEDKLDSIKKLLKEENDENKPEGKEGNKESNGGGKKEEKKPEAVH